MSNEEQNAVHKPRFDGTVNLGHILTAVTMLMGGIVVWSQAQVGFAKQDSRISALELGQVEIRVIVAKLTENQQATLRNQDKIATTLEFVVNNQKSK